MSVFLNGYTSPSSRMERRRSHEGSSHSANERDNSDDEEEDRSVDSVGDMTRGLISGGHPNRSPGLYEADDPPPPVRLSSFGKCPRLFRAVLFVGVAVVVLSYFALHAPSSPIALLYSLDPSSLSSSSLFPVPSPGRSLFIYVHSENDGQHLPNFLYFLRKAVRCWQDADYVFIIQRDDADSLNATDPKAPWRLRFPPLPPNARYVLHKNECMDWGTAGWLLNLPDSHPDHVNTARYRYFFLVNSSVKGPFLPLYLEDHMDPDAAVQCPAHSEGAEAAATQGLFPWFHVFLAKLSPYVKLVGCTISCEIDTHVQSYVLAFDYLTLQLLWQVDGWRVKDGLHPVHVEKDFARWQRFKGGIRALNQSGPALTCPVDYAIATRQGEVGASQTVLSAGYNLAVTERFWHGVDFRLGPDLCSLNTWIGNPSALGVPLDRMKGRTEHVGLVPWDTVFVKVKEKLTHPHDALTNAIVRWEDLAARTQKWQRAHINGSKPTRKIIFPH